MSSKYNIALIGCGKMGGAMLRSWVENGIVSDAYIVDPAGVPSEIHHDSITSYPSAQHLQGKPIDAVIVAVKPQILESACSDIQDFIGQDTLVLSIAAGKDLNCLQSVFGDTPIIRSMPNTPASIGKGVCVCIGNQNVDNTQRDVANSLLSVTGQVEWINDEMLMDAVTALSGSGPAYLFYLIEILTKAGVSVGLERDLSEKLARQTVIGSAALAEASPSVCASTLRENVTSPNGTTQAALDVLTDGRIERIFEEALSSARKRSKELNQ